MLFLASFLSSFETLHNAEGGREEGGERVLERNQEPILRVERVKRTLIKEVLIIVNSSFSDHLLVGAIDLSDDHFEKNNATQKSEKTQ